MKVTDMCMVACVYVYLSRPRAVVLKVGVWVMSAREYEM